MLYGDKDSYVDEVDERIDELIEEGWALEQFADELHQRVEEADRFP